MVLAALWHTNVAVLEVPDECDAAQAQTLILAAIDRGEIVFESTEGGVGFGRADVVALGAEHVLDLSG